MRERVLIALIKNRRRTRSLKERKKVKHGWVFGHGTGVLGLYHINLALDMGMSNDMA